MVSEGKGAWHDTNRRLGAIITQALALHLYQHLDMIIYMRREHRLAIDH